MSANPERPPTASEHEGHQERYSDGLRWWPRHSKVRDFSEIFLYDGSIVAQLDFLHHPLPPRGYLRGFFLPSGPLKKGTRRMRPSSLGTTKRRNVGCSTPFSILGHGGSIGQSSKKEVGRVLRQRR